MATEDTDDDFFEVPKSSSLKKIAIVERYFKKWASVMVHNQEAWRLTGSIRFTYIDLYSGPGVYSDETPSTPIRVLNAASAIDKPDQTAKFLPYFAARFNDARPDRIEELERQIAKRFPNNEFRAEQIKTSSIELTNDISNFYKDLGRIPSLSFIDPFGIKGMTKELIGRLISNRGSDCILFFNYKKFNRFITADHYRVHMNSFFGIELADQLRLQFQSSNKSVQSRENLIVQSVKAALNSVGARPVEPFKFLDEDGSRTSHFLFIATKHELGERYWKRAIKSESEVTHQGVTLFEFSPKPDLSKSDHFQTKLDLKDGPLDKLTRTLELELKGGRPRKVSDLSSKFTAGTPYVDKNIKDALLKLEAEGKITIVRSANRGVGTPIGDSALVTWKASKGV